MSDFHKSNAWRKLARDHKTLRCKCNSTKDIQSSHYLPQKRFPMMRLWKINLYHACKACNGKLGDRINWSFRAVQLLVIYGMIKGLINGALMAVFAFCLVVVYKDLASGGMEASFSGQLLIEIWGLFKELIQSVLESATNLASDRLDQPF